MLILVHRSQNVLAGKIQDAVRRSSLSKGCQATILLLEAVNQRQ